MNPDENWDKIIIPDDWLWKIARIKSSNDLRIIAVHGYSMAPAYKDGDLVLVDASVRGFIGSGIYIFKKNDHDVYIKKLDHMMDDKLKVASLNSEYDSYVLNSKTNIKLEILGKVVCQWQYEFV